MLPLTKKQAQAKAFIVAHIAEHDQAPSFTEMMAGLDIKSKGNMSARLAGLERRGHIIRGPGQERAIAVVKEAEGGLRQIKDAAHVFVATQEQFRRDFTDDRDSSQTRRGQSLVAAALNNLKWLLKTT
jgi:SOS-response transcriptional repressor LexA|tara:strand:+ start:1077 stop:1460 length:384 start_codon:yes stop_codon:yes gene_type:complete